MTRSFLLLLLACIVAACSTTKDTAISTASKNKKTVPIMTKVDYTMPQLVYPETRQDNVVDNYHGTEVADPYRWLEDDNSTETVDWVKRQNEVTQQFLKAIPYRAAIEKRLGQLWDYTRYSSPFREGESFYYFKNDGLQNQSVLYASADPKSEGIVFLDPNSFSDDGTSSLAGMSFNKAGDKLAYLVSEGGSDWRTAYVMDVATRQVTSDRLEWLKFTGISWAGDGFYYSRYPEPKEGDELSAANAYHAVYYHQLGTDQSADRLIYVDNDHPQRNVYAQTTEDERFLILSQSESTSGNAVKVMDLSKPAAKLVDIVTTFDADFSLIDSDGSNLLILTNSGAPKQKVIAIDTEKPSAANWQTVIPESTNPLTDVSVVGSKLFANYMNNASSKVEVYSMKGKKLTDLTLPGIGSTGGVSGKKGDSIGFYSFTSYTRPTTIYKLNTNTLKSEIFRQPTVDFDSDAYETKQVFYESKDGTKVPMFITMKKGTVLDGTNPTLLYGYGGFNISLTPGFSLTKLPLLENGGIYVVANLRGGGEFGKEWHTAGTLGQKQNVFDDFIAAAEYLIANNYTSKEKLAIEGGSNGGLLVGACMTQRPELFQVAFPRVGVLDMLRYHEFTIGWAWAGDYGRSDEPEAFEYLIKYSPLHNVKKTAYPATMVMTADHDDRVVPAHSFKYAAELQKQHTGTAPTIIRIDTSAGHGAGKPTSKSIEEAADALGFMLFNMKENYTLPVK